MAIVAYPIGPPYAFFILRRFMPSLRTLGPGSPVSIMSEQVLRYHHHLRASARELDRTVKSSSSKKTRPLATFIVGNVRLTRFAQSADTQILVTVKRAMTGKLASLNNC